MRQVLEWTQTMLAAGEAFCGSESATLRDALQRQSGRFFAAYHSANLQVRCMPGCFEAMLLVAAASGSRPPPLCCHECCYAHVLCLLHTLLCHVSGEAAWCSLVSLLHMA